MKSYIFCIICCCIWTSAAAQSLDPVPRGMLFEWDSQRCARWDIVDTPARAWRDAALRVHLLAGAETSRTSVGDALSLSMERDCVPRLVSGHDPDPAQRNDRLWIASIFTQDGQRVEALVHAEYHGHRHEGRCAAVRYMPCWRNAILAATSTDGGQTFVMDAVPVAMLPYRYDPAQTRRSGYFNPSNMFLYDGWIYAFFFAEKYKAQERGTCLMRRAVGAGAQDWRFWDGQGFEGRFADPYTMPIAAPDAHVCTPLQGVRSVLSSVIQRAGQFLAVTPMTGRNPDGEPASGIWALHSTDLVNWERPQLLIEAPLLWRRDCTLPYAIAYPSLLDPQSASRLFDIAGTDFWLTYVRIALNEDCRAQARRDLFVHDLNWPLPAAGASGQK